MTNKRRICPRCGREVGPGAHTCVKRIPPAPEGLFDPEAWNVNAGKVVPVHDGAEVVGQVTILAGGLVSRASPRDDMERSVDQAIIAMYRRCGDAWVDSADIDQWWRVTLACDHGKWVGISNGAIDCSTAFNKALIKMEAAEHPDPFPGGDGD